MTELQNEDTNNKHPQGTFPVVGIGASAGGLDAFKRLISAIPENSGMAYILVQHMEPTHESLLPELLQKVTPLPVEEITNNVLVEPGHIYIIPANKMLTAVDGHLQLSPRPSKNERNMPIDVFFTSLAEVHQGRSIGVVLSGTASDGTLGLKAIKEYGGFTFAQEPGSAAAKGMPQSAIDAEVADFVLLPEDIPFQLSRLMDTLIDSQEEEEPPDAKAAREEVFRELIHLLRLRKGTDFTYYKQTTVRRRILRRMALHNMESIGSYLTYFKENAGEIDLLYQDLLIPVTGFFRDPKIFDFLSRSVFPSLLKGKDAVNPLRIWIAGCSTGEEPYSLAICLHEYLGERMADCKIQIFASDLSEKSIAKARIGLYSRRDIGGLSASRLQRYFTKVNGSFQINKLIRDMCVFACHNFLKDPPFARMDLVSCRNVLIYMDTFLQKRALTTFHYALNRNGYLLLGNSETAAPAADLFSVLGKNEKLYTRKPMQGRLPSIAADRTEKAFRDLSYDARTAPARDDFQKSADEMLLTSYTPPGVVVNELMDIVQFRGSTGAWLEPSPGKPNMNVLKMAREGLAFELRNVLHKAKAAGKAAVKEHIPIRFTDQHRWVTVEVIPLPNTAEPYYLILFREETNPSGDKDSRGIEDDPEQRRQNADSLRVLELERELAQLREDMKNITEDQEAVNEELQSANEELLSGSEELQSLNEELETSKEEIQSTNEELTTLNQELFDRNEQLNMSRLYAESIVATTREPLIVLDKDLKVKTANAAYYKKFGSSEDDTEGVSFFSLGKGQWDIPDLHRMLAAILTANTPVTDFEIRHRFETVGERVLLLNGSRIFQKESTELMVLLAIEDVTEIRDREQDLENKVKERTSSLRDVNISLKYSNERLEQYATIASHDLQEPLRKIRTFAAILNQRYDNQLSSEARELLRKISASAERMATLIHDVLNFAKVLDANKFESVDLDLILENVIDDYSLLITQKKAMIRHDPLPAIQAVPLQMNQLFYNLLGNALKFAKEDLPPVISISSRTLTAEEVSAHTTLNGEGPYLEIIVQDNGIGFDQQFASKIFQVFQRLNSAERFEGTGIGLALCQRIVINHLGDITVRSEPGIGTKFYLILPME